MLAISRRRIPGPLHLGRRSRRNRADGWRGLCRHGAERQVRSARQGRRGARSEPEPARHARHRHPLRPDRGGRGRHSRRGADACWTPPASWSAGPDRPACPRLPVRLGHRHPGRRAGAVPGHDHARLRRRRRRQQLRRLPPLHRRRRRARACSPSCTSPTSASPASRCPSSTTSTSRRPTPPPGRWPRTPTSCIGIKVRMSRERDRQARPRAAQARDPRLRDGRQRREGHVPHRRRRDAGADVARSSTCCGRATS